MRHSATARTTFDPPLGEMNTTPLIDVMLVLLVMFILAVPAAVNQVPIDLPGPSPIVDHPVHPDKNSISIDPSNRISWNDQTVTPNELTSLLQATRKLRPEPELRFEPDPAAPYDTAAKVLDAIKASGVSAFGFIGNEQYAQFGKAAAPPLRR